MSTLQIIQLAQLNDNYSWLVICNETNDAAVIDCPEAAPMIARIEEAGVTPSAILNTHHHWDHTGGNEELLAKWPDLKVYGYHSDEKRVPGLNATLQEGDTVHVGNCSATILSVPGHTSGDIAYWFEGSDALFCGDSMFVAGCGRIFEGTAEQMYSSLQKIGKLPPQTKLYCGHEYTASSIRFALHIDPDNQDLQALEKEVAAKREKNEPTVPSTLEVEWKCNPFLRVTAPAIQQAATKAGATSSEPVAVLAAIREQKNNF